MGAAQQPQGTGRPERSSRVLYQSQNAQITWHTDDADPAGRRIVKELRGPDGGARARNEASVLKRLAGVPGVSQLARPYAGGSTLELADPLAAPLADLLRSGPLPLPRLLHLGLAIARIVAAMHRAGVVHKDLNPANVLLVGPAGEPYVIDFGLATTFAQERPGFTHQNELAGTRAYLAPEQTGRTGRSVDQRSDLYALGATLYEAATGQPPFPDGDPLQLIRDHLATVPQPPSELNPALPIDVGRVILRLLEKEPDRRYQSAEGLAHDLAELARRLQATATTAAAGTPDATAHGTENPPSGFRLGERDFPHQLRPPAMLVGREHELAALRAGFEAAITGAGRGLLVTGAPGVGKTALIDELRPIVTVSGGWFVTGKFDQFRRDGATNAVWLAIRSLGRLLLAEPEEELVVLRARIGAAVGSNAGLIAEILPEFAILLQDQDGGAPAQPSDERRVVRAMLDLLRAVVSAQRPLVMVIDDLQWADPTSIAFVDAVLVEPELTGLLLLGAYRDGEVGATHPLTAAQSHWARLAVAPTLLRLANLPVAELAHLLREMLRVTTAQAEQLAQVVGNRTAGNPFDTVELINALRRDGVLVAGDGGWSWDDGAIRRFVGPGDVVGLLTERIEALPAPTRCTLRSLACLGGQVALDVLAIAVDLALPDLEDELRPALEDGLLVLEAGGAAAVAAVRFRHDRVQEACHATLAADDRRELQLSLARRLAGRSDLALLAAEQYLPAVAGLHDPAEARAAAGLLHAAGRAARTSSPPAAERFLAAAAALLAAHGSAPGHLQQATSVAVGLDRHALLFHLGRLEEADEVFGWLAEHAVDLRERALASCVQVASLTNRGLPAEAIALALPMLGELGLPLPAGGDASADLDARLAEFYRLVEADAGVEDERPDVQDELLLLTAQLIHMTTVAALFVAPDLLCWLVVEAQRLWSTHGPCSELMTVLTHAPCPIIELRGDYSTGYRAARQVFQVGLARGYESAQTKARFVFAWAGRPWFEPLDDTAEEAHGAFEALLRAGDVQGASHTCSVSILAALECSATLEPFLDEAQRLLAYARRTRNDVAATSTMTALQLGLALSGRAMQADEEVEGAPASAPARPDLGQNPANQFEYHLFHAIGALYLGEWSVLATHSEPLERFALVFRTGYRLALMHLVRGMSLAARARSAPIDEKARLLGQLGQCRDWMAARAADAPANFAHLAGLLDAEHAWAARDVDAAMRRFDATLRLATGRRPGHLALITERAAAFHLEQGLEHAGRALMVQARDRYQAWGAAAKVEQLQRRHVYLRDAVAPSTAGTARQTLTISAASVDLMAVLEASRALSSETSLERLQARVSDVLGAITGATTVKILLREDGATAWTLPASPGRNEAALDLDRAGERGLLPMSIVRYLERTMQVLLLPDATRDDRFARDPYLAGLERCSLLGVPITVQGVPRAMVLLENRLSTGTFSADRLDAVQMIAGQLAVSLDNAMLYASLERKVAERSAELAAANARLAELSITDQLTDLFNRRRFDQGLSEEWLRGLRTAQPLSLAMIDVDHFKLYNDEYGHPGGDECLRRVAGALRGAFRRGVDLVTRYGGEEFAVLLPATELAEARIAAERARLAVEGMQLAHARHSVGVVTASIGIAALTPTPDTDPADLMAAADAQLYEAKRAGRNRVSGQDKR